MSQTMIEFSVNLTPREQEVLRVLVQGLSNKQLARELSISVHTVEQHLKHIYAKLTVSSRSEACCWYWRERGGCEK